VGGNAGGLGRNCGNFERETPQGGQTTWWGGDGRGGKSPKKVLRRGLKEPHGRCGVPSSEPRIT